MLLGILLAPLGMSVDGLALALPGVAMVLRAPLGMNVDIAASITVTVATTKV